MKRSVSAAAVLLCLQLLFSCALPAAYALPRSDREEAVPAPGATVTVSEQTPPAQRKISLSALDAMAEASDDELVSVAVFLKPPSDLEIEALVPVPMPGEAASEEERLAYAQAKKETRDAVYAGVTDAFVQRYLDDSVQITGLVPDSPGFRCSVQKSGIAGLAEPDEVLRITGGESIYLIREKSPQEKITQSLAEAMDDIADDALVPVRIWLRGPLNEEVDILSTVRYPDVTATQQEIQAYRDASGQARQEASNDRAGVFAQNHLDDGDAVLFRGSQIPIVIVTVPKSKILTLASLQIVSQIDAAFYFDGLQPSPSEDPAVLRKYDRRLLEFLSIAAQDDRIPVAFDLTGPSQEEIVALIPISEPGPGATSEEIEAYRAAKLAATQEAYSAVTNAFVTAHLDASDEVLYVGSYTATVAVIVPKPKVEQLAGQNVVRNLSWNISYNDPLVPGSGEAVFLSEPEARPQKDPAVYEKVSPYLFGCLEALPDDAGIPVRFDLTEPSEEELEAMVPVPAPGAGATAEEVNAYLAAKRKVQKEVISGITGTFRQQYLDETDTVCFSGNYNAVVIAVVPKAKLLTLAAPDEVVRIDRAPEQGTPEFPEGRCEHEYEQTQNAPTCTETGRTTHTCALCGDTYWDTEAPALGHDFVGGVCTRCGAEAPEPPSVFDDVKDQAQYFFAPVYWAYNHDPQITTGVSDTAFGPEEGCTRAQVVTFLWRAAGKPEAEGVDNPFSDVPAGEYYTDAVLWAVKNGITNGTSETTFGSEETCTRAQIVTFLWRAAGKPAAEARANPFKDVPEGEYYTDAVLWAVKEGITTGTEPDAFSPEDTCTRGQIVTFLFRDAKGE